MLTQIQVASFSAGRENLSPGTESSAIILGDDEIAGCITFSLEGCGGQITKCLQGVQCGFLFMDHLSRLSAPQPHTPDTTIQAKVNQIDQHLRAHWENPYLGSACHWLRDAMVNVPTNLLA